MGQESGSFWRYACRRMAHAVPLILGVVVVNFTLIQLAPGDPILALIGEFQASPEFVQGVRQQFGLDRPLPVQLGLYLLQSPAGGLRLLLRLQAAGPEGHPRPGAGHAPPHGRGHPVCHHVRRPLRRHLVAAAVLPITDNFFTVVALIGYSMPVFWLGQILLILFGLHLPDLPRPGHGIAAGILHRRRPRPRHPPPPGAARLHLGLGYLAVDVRFTRASMIEVMSQDYIRTARAKGLSEQRRLLQARPAQCPDSPGDHHRAQLRVPPGRRGAHRDGVCLAGPGPAHVRLDLRAGLSRAHGDVRRHLDDGDRRQPHHGRRVFDPGSRGSESGNPMRQFWNKYRPQSTRRRRAGHRASASSLWACLPPGWPPSSPSIPGRIPSVLPTPPIAWERTTWAGIS